MKFLNPFHMKWKRVKVLVAQSVWLFVTPWSIRGIFQARILEWVAIPFSRASSQPRDWTRVSCIAGRFFTVWTTREVPFHMDPLQSWLVALLLFWVPRPPSWRLPIVFSTQLLSSVDHWRLRCSHLHLIYSVHDSMSQEVKIQWNKPPL